MADRHVLPTAQIAGIVQRCVDIQKKLENIKNNLNKFLEDKRMLFPRFSFLSDDDLLKILCLSQRSVLRFRTKGDKDALVGRRGYSPRPPTQPRLHSTRRGEILRCCEDLAVRLKSRKTPKWVISHKLQMLLVSGQIVWTAQIEHINNNSKPSQIKKDIKQLRIQQKILLPNLAQMVSQSRMSAPDRLKLVSLITIEDHAREVLRNLAHSKVKDVNDFLWKQQLKVYKPSVTVNTGDDNNSKAGGPQQQLNQTVQREDHIIAEQTNWSFRYGYEYLGCTDRLVVTSLTDRCSITLVTALYLKLGGNQQTSRDGTVYSSSARLSKTDSNQIESMKNEDTGRAVIIESAVTVSTGSAPSSIVTFCNSSSSDSSRLVNWKRNNVDGVVKRRGGVELTADLAIAEWDGWDRVGTTRLVDPSMHARLCDLFQLCWLRALVDWNPNELDCARGVELLLHSMFPFVFLIIVVDCSSFGGIFPS
ncbi:putative Dynein axonemal heavy chain 2 [Blattamonas nauphoetae]|uniref:Dynein axonemal heavy chain 2 n=1 Tax=Blattamonas nauphoetae TaxID=2049346 RepID=A0ABQ9Y3Z7_9EUKA|nr:putative Dynein axonemal heavy chain 2 [Blattamonas nauphoetae]